MFVSLLRLIFVLAAVMLASFSFDILTAAGLVPDEFDLPLVVGFIVVGGGIGFVLGGVIGRPLAEGVRRVEEFFGQVPATDLIFGNIGLIFGLMLAYFVFPLFREVGPLGLVLAAVFFLVSGAVGFQIFRGRTRSIERMLAEIGKGPHQGGHTGPGKILDTSIIIDGRISAVCRAGFIEGELKIPRFVLKELQMLADSANDSKRRRARAGLGGLNELQKEFPGRIRVVEDDVEQEEQVDQKLLQLAKRDADVIVTVDYNLQKVAEVQGAHVLNINELATALKPPFFPGEEIRIKVVKRGKEKGQGVGYLDDGTMVVVEEGQGHVGRDVEARVGSVLQTNTGKMVFAKLK